MKHPKVSHSMIIVLQNLGPVLFLVHIDRFEGDQYMF